MSKVHPSELLKTLTAEARPQKRRNLEVMHEVCAELYRLGSLDYSLATVGRLSQERGGMSQRALYNSTSGDFKTLVRAWANFAAPIKKSPSDSRSRDSLLTDNDLLQKIADPALRVLLGHIIAERDRLRGEVKLLRANASVVVDRRVLPGHINVTPKGEVIQVMSSAGLSDTEKQALIRAISAEFLSQEGWSEGANGEILNPRGRKLFDIGFINAIKKTLAS
ncbi:alpha/beta hydrolase [Pseudoduganella sp. DS3]|uniref:Alpha/beta hydrolase n=1 Tax=Pseudoduganella guangdongensis TaxID=2692179 RepID=A0A6N9HBH2_9BURK|nr:gamma-mobile-trio protein GmtX [Pseudoduganella guangdongensis]MYN00844.1 alpha/beta hydrolase [Pseudoduganella guangdongensis]